MSLSDRTRFYLAGAVAPSTARSYDRSITLWLEYAARYNVTHLPADPIHFGNCLSSLADSHGSFSKISSLVAAVSRLHWDNFLPSPTESFAFRRLLQGFRRLLSKPPKQKDPLTIEMLASAIQIARSGNRLQEWRTVARMNLSFFAGCRWSDLALLKLSHFKFSDSQDGVSIHIPRSKTDQLGRGDDVFIKAIQSPSCPVLFLKDYFAKLNYEGQDGFFQPRIKSLNGIQRGIMEQSLSYSTALSDLKLLLSVLGYDPSQGLSAYNASGSHSNLVDSISPNTMDAFFSASNKFVS